MKPVYDKYTGSCEGFKGMVIPFSSYAWSSKTFLKPFTSVLYGVTASKKFARKHLP